ncbi:hypothetical protein SUGI_0009760 [Cryptomeria japonica]|uniref:replication protein A 70 kDa DNA-binding subunit A-like n=1 Tax=Cryptomeria japonica TaxID=3369 RepID=UPI002408CFA8|nr:replication protein A 70 kDa DNA-binding subunit A-like [Cryptomeria japonica]GLJ05031.1 hypothetical protein SUGI_0009760 [Cryptomeria japonica]
MLNPDVVLILVVHNGRVEYFNGKVVNMTSATTLHINPPFPKAEPLMLRGPLPLQPHDLSSGFSHIDGRYSSMTFSSIRECMCVRPEAIQTTIVVVLRFVNVTDDDFYYATYLKLMVNLAKKNALNRPDDSWFCPRCQMSMVQCNYNYHLPMKLQDVTGTLWATAFDEVGIDLIKKNAKELYMLQNGVNTTQTPRVVINTVVLHRYTFTLLVSTDTYNFEPKLKVAINKVYEVGYIAECNALLAKIARLSTQP